MRKALFGLLVLGSAGCYHYQPVAEAPPAPGTEIRAHLAPDAAQDYTSRFGPNVQVLDGRMLYAEGNEIGIAVDWVTTAQATFDTGGQGLSLPRANVRLLEAKTLSVGKSILLGVGIAAGFYVLGANAGTFKGSPGGDDGKDPGNQDGQGFWGVRIPLRLP